MSPIHLSSNALPSAGVFPVVDYEPPAAGEARSVAPIRLRPPNAPAPAAPDGPGGQTLAAATFAEAALRRVLEVVDRRRPLAQLRGLLAAGLVDSLLGGGGGDGPARLRRVRAQLTGPTGTAAEVSAHYTRGQRVHAIACRVEQRPTATGPCWQVVALHLG